MLRVGLLGCGVVGGGLVELLTTRGESLGLRLVRVAVADRARARPELPPSVPVGSVEEVLADPEVDVVVELIGGVEPALGAIRTALESKKAVVTANKAVVAAHGDELRALASHYGVGFRYEASVAGCLPIVEILENELIFDRTERLIGILNGTCNFVLTRCLQAGLTYEDALREAQAAGFAEADPTLDVSGADTAQKLSILVGLLTGRSCASERIPTQGIESVTPADHRAAAELGYVLKLLALYRRGAPSQVRVAPTLVPKDSAVGLTINEYNAVEVECTHIGWQLYLGKGAGRMPTASAVLHDLVRVYETAPKPSRGGAPLDLADAADWTAPWLLRAPEALSVKAVGAKLGGIDVLELRRSDVGTLVLTADARTDQIAEVSQALGAVAYAIEPDA